MKWFWGIILILAGVILIGINTNYLDADQLYQFAKFWPLLLIIYGTGLAFRHYRFGWIITLLVIIASIAFIGYSTKNNLHFQNNFSGNAPTISKFQADLPSAADSAKIIIDSGAVDLKLRSTSDDLIHGSLSSRFLQPKLTTKTSNDQTIVTLDTASSFHNWPHGKNKLDVFITDEVPVNLQLNVGASQLNLDTSNIMVKEMTISCGASNIDLKIGKTIQDNAAIKISSGASNISISLPREIGVKISNDSALSNLDTKDFTKVDKGTYESNDYQNKDKKITIHNSSGASSININWY